MHNIYLAIQHFNTKTFLFTERSINIFYFLNFWLRILGREILSLHHLFTFRNQGKEK